MSQIVTAGDAQIDLREQLFNDGAVGPIAHVQLPVETITSLRGILFDLDLPLMHASPLLPQLPENPRGFYDGTVKVWLSRNTTLAKSEVRNSGAGIHAILRLSEPVVFHSDAERNRWAGIVQVVQAALPIDPDQPRITATTRAIGSVNSKNGQTVELLANGEPVSVEEVMSLFDAMIKSPFKTVFKILGGGDDLLPCPICGKPGTRLRALDYVGRCYGSCGKVGLKDLHDVVLAPRPKTE